MALYVHGLRLNYHLGQLTRRCQYLDPRDGHLLDCLLVCCPGSGVDGSVPPIQTAHSQATNNSQFHRSSLIPKGIKQRSQPCDVTPHSRDNSVVAVAHLEYEGGWDHSPHG